MTNRSHRERAEELLDTDDLYMSGLISALAHAVLDVADAIREGQHPGVEVEQGMGWPYPEGGAMEEPPTDRSWLQTEDSPSPWRIT